jgi:hypothetical protein
VNSTNDVKAAKPIGNRRVIRASCSLHGGSVGFTNLVVSKHGGQTELDPHAAGARTITLEEDGSRALRDALIEWLR